MYSRLLYSNPVCIVSTSDSLMVASWLSPIDNNGHFTISINEKRHSLPILLEKMSFVLNIASLNNQELVLAVGGISGRDGDKYSRLSLERTFDGRWCYLDGMPGRLNCLIDESLVRHGHVVLVCTIVSATVDDAYWNGKQLLNDKDPTLTFLGTKTFGYIRSV